MRTTIIRVVVLMTVAIAAAIVDLVRPALVVNPALAKPAYMDRYNRDHYARPELIDKCTVCHVGRGGAQRNDFGDAFEDNGYRVTPKLRAKFPQFFVPEPHKGRVDELAQQPE